MSVLERKNRSARGAEEKEMKKEKEIIKMFKTVLTYFAAKKVITCVVLAAMLIGVMAVACVAAVFAPKASADEMNPYAGKTFEMTDKKVGTFSFYVTDDNHVMAIYPDNNRIGYTYNCFVAESGELVILDENNDSSIFVGAMNTDGTLLEFDGTVWSCAD